MTEWVVPIVRGYNVAWMCGSVTLIIVLLYCRARFTVPMRSYVFSMRMSGFGLVLMLAGIVLHRLFWHIAGISVSEPELERGLVYASWSQYHRVWLAAPVAMFLWGAAYGVDFFAHPVLGKRWRVWFSLVCVLAFSVGFALA